MPCLFLQLGPSFISFGGSVNSLSPKLILYNINLMKNTTLLIIIIIVVSAAIITVLFVNSRKEHDIQIPLNPLAPSFLYSISNEEEKSEEIRLFEIPTNNDYLIHGFSLTSPGIVPTISRLFQDKLLLDLESSDQFLISISKRSVEIVPSTDLGQSQLLSPNGTYLAFNRTKSDTVGLLDDTELVIQSKNGEERTLESGSVGEIGVGLLTPLHWSEDEKKLYSYRGHATEGDIVGLYEIDVLTLEQNRIEAVDELGISKYVFDNLGNVYGFKPFYRIRPEDKLQNTFYRVSLTTGEVTDFTLQNSSLIDMYTIDHSGRFLAYANGDNFDSQDVWIYDLDSGEEYPVTNNAIVYDVLQWNDGKIVFIEHSASQPAQSKIIVFDYNKNTSNVIFEGEGEIIDLIGWYYK